MNRYGFLLATVIVATLAAGCATNGSSSSAANDEDKVTVTGSRIPVKDHTAANKTTDKKDIDDFARQQRVFVPSAGGAQ